jgi:phosphoribosylformylglycinamidine (FGAM) synthase PurS component
LTHKEPLLLLRYLVLDLALQRPEQLAQVEKAAETLLANPVIETFTVRVEK